MPNNQNNNFISINDTIADILYHKIQTQFKTFGEPVFYITDHDVFRAAVESRRPNSISVYRLELVVRSLNKIKGVSTAYFRENADEPDGEIIVRLKV